MMKKWIAIILSYVVLTGALAMSLKTAKNMEEKWKTAETNVKSYDKLLSSAKGRNTAYQLTAKQLSHASDSIFRELNAVRKELKIKDNHLKSLQHITSSFSKTDTIVMRDTLFREPELSVDTVMGDEWYKVELGLRHPSTIILKPEFKSEKNIVVSTKKETVNPPKKWWLLRLFQKKHTVIKVDVVEKNPYVSDEESRYVEIIK